MAFDQLTRTGRLRRLRRLARVALSEFGLDGCRLTLVAQSYNIVFRVTGSAEAYVLRVGPSDQVHGAGVVAAEARWTDELRAKGLDAPRLVATSRGAFSVRSKVEGVPGEHECSLLTWTSGMRLVRPLGTPDVRALAALSAQMHAASPPRPVRPPGALDGRAVLHFDGPDLLADTDEPARSTFLAARERTQAALETLWCNASEPPRLIHADLTAANVVRGRGRLLPIDFQDLTWGYPHQDLANSTYGFVRDDPSGQSVEVFRSAYAEHRPWPADLDDELLFHLHAARRLSMANLALRLRRPGFEAYLTTSAEALGHYLGGG